jgi:hypothetical protein
VRRDRRRESRTLERRASRGLLGGKQHRRLLDGGRYLMKGFLDSARRRALGNLAGLGEVERGQFIALLCGSRHRRRPDRRSCGALAPERGRSRFLAEEGECHVDQA